MTTEGTLLMVQHEVTVIAIWISLWESQLDSVSSGIEALPEVAREKGSGIVDVGISRGRDVFEMFALRADFTLIGRPAVWGFARRRRMELSRVMPPAEARDERDRSWIVNTQSLRHLVPPAILNKQR
jgi:hypothetical protein